MQMVKTQSMDAHNNVNRCYKFLQIVPKNGLQQMLLNSLWITAFEQNKNPNVFGQESSENSSTPTAVFI